MKGPYLFYYIVNQKLMFSKVFVYNCVSWLIAAHHNSINQAGSDGVKAESKDDDEELCKIFFYEILCFFNSSFFCWCSCYCVLFQLLIDRKCWKKSNMSLKVVS